MWQNSEKWVRACGRGVALTKATKVWAREHVKVEHGHQTVKIVVHRVGGVQLRHVCKGACKSSANATEGSEEGESGNVPSASLQVPAAARARVPTSVTSPKCSILRPPPHPRQGADISQATTLTSWSKVATIQLKHHRRRKAATHTKPLSHGSSHKPSQA